MPPTGGPEDRTPPNLLKETPADSSTNIKPKKIEIYFDKYINLGDYASEMNVSPLLPIPPTVQSLGKKVVITLIDTMLEDNTTYTINLGNAIKDNRENTPYANYTYTFSTGNYFDSLSLNGIAIDAQSGKSDTGFLAILYLADQFTDSNILTKRPFYVTKVSNSGTFQFQNLPEKKFSIFILQDNDNSLTYTPGIDKIAFRESIVQPNNESNIIMYAFQEKGDSTIAIPPTSETNQRREGRANKSLLPSLPEGVNYMTLVDSAENPKVLQELNKPIIILIDKKITQINNDKIYLTFEKEGVSIEAIHRVEKTDSTILIHTDWQENTMYTLRLIKGWGVDSNGNELLPNKYNFRTKSFDEYANLELTFPDSFVNNQYIYILKKDEEIIEQKRILNTVDSLHLLSDGNYHLSVFKDLDNNGEWTTGDFFKKRQPEIVLPNTITFILKPGWSHKYTYEPTIIFNDKSARSTSDRANAIKNEEEK